MTNSYIRDVLVRLDRLWPAPGAMYWAMTFFVGFFVWHMNEIRVSLLSDQELSRTWWAILLGVYFPAGIALVWWRMVIGGHIRARPVVDVDLTPQEIERHSRLGLIALVSLYNPLKGSADTNVSTAELTDRISRLDHKNLDLAHSNLNQLIQAITSHKSKLRHCWLLVSAPTQRNIGSEPVAKLLEKYCKDSGISCEFHLVHPVPQEAENLLCEKVRERVDQVFEDAARLGLREADLACDCTGGVRAMQLGMILACLDGNRDLELMFTIYDASGQPTDNLRRMWIHFEPRLVPSY